MDAVSEEQRPVVVLLHGLGRTHRSLSALRREIEAAGWPTWSRTYPSRRLGIGKLARELSSQIRKEVGERPVLAVTHSLGGVLVRHMRDLLPWRGVVMLAPPNRGSRVAAALRDHPLFGWFAGPAGRELADPSRWPEPPRPFAVIAGRGGATVGNPPSWVIRAMRLLPAGVAHDGTVTTEETQLPGMACYAEIDASHTWIMHHPEARRLVLRFLETQSF